MYIKFTLKLRCQIQIQIQYIIHYYTYIYKTAAIGRGGCVPGWCKAGVSVGFSQWYPGVSWGIRGYPGCGRTGTPEKHVGKQALRSNWQGYPVLVLRLNIILRDLFPPVKGTKSAQLPPPRPKTDLSPSRCIFLWADQPIKKIS